MKSATARTSGSRWAAWRSAPIWGHGSYVAPDWTADWLHREAVFILDRWSGYSGRRSRACPTSARPSSASRLHTTACGRTPTTRSRHADDRPVRAEAFDANLAHYTDVFARRPRRVRHPAGRAHRPGQAAEAGGLLLLDVVGCVDQPSGRHDHLHEQLAARAAGRQPSHRRRDRLDRSSASSCCSPASARWRSGMRRSPRDPPGESSRRRPAAGLEGDALAARRASSTSGSCRR